MGILFSINTLWGFFFQTFNNVSLSSHAQCLEDKIRVFKGLPKLNETYPGQRYSSTMQCKLWLGIHATVCSVIFVCFLKLLYILTRN
jgi:hypothetical protein